MSSALLLGLNLADSEASGIAFFKMDVTSSSEIAEVAAEIRKSHGEPTVLVS